EKDHLKKNTTAQPKDSLFLTKPLGIGILSTAQKKGILQEKHQATACASMIDLNKIGRELGKIPEVSAMTDVTGFGLLGHLLELCEGSNVNAKIDFNQVPLLADLDFYLE